MAKDDFFNQRKIIVPLFSKDFSKQHNYSCWSQIWESQVEERAQIKEFHLFLLALAVSVYCLIMSLSSVVFELHVFVFL